MTAKYMMIPIRVDNIEKAKELGKRLDNRQEAPIINAILERGLEQYLKMKIADSDVLTILADEAQRAKKLIMSKYKESDPLLDISERLENAVSEIDSFRLRDVLSFIGVPNQEIDQKMLRATALLYRSKGFVRRSVRNKNTKKTETMWINPRK